MNLRRTCFWAMLVVAAIWAVPAGAAVRTWDNGDPGTSRWIFPGNWSPNGYSDSDNLIVTGDLVATFGAPVPRTNLRTNNGGSVTLHGPASVADFSAYSVRVAESGEARLEVLSAADLYSGFGSIGIGSGTVGHAIVSGAGSTWAMAGDLTVADYGAGTLAIHEGGAVSNRVAVLGSVQNAAGHVIVSGAGSTWDCSGMWIGDNGTGTLTITDGGVVSNDSLAYTSRNTGSQGTVTVSGAGSRWTNSDVLYIGSAGAASLSINDGGDVSNSTGYVGYLATAEGQVTVSGPGSTWTNRSRLYVGREGAASLSINGGGSVSNSIGYMGYNADGSADAVVSGQGSTWDNRNELYVGREGTGTLLITGGGAVSDSIGSIGSLTDSVGDVTVSGAGSHWDNRSSLHVGQRGTGTLDIDNGGSVSNTFGYVGRFGNASGEVTVSGAGSTWKNFQLYVGYEGTGTLTIADGGAVDVATLLIIGAVGAPKGTVNLQGGSLTAQSVGTWTGAAEFNFTGGTLAITGAGGLTLDSDGLLGPIVGINRNKGLNVSAATTVNAGVKLAVAGGNFSTETLNVSGTVQLRAGTITIGDTFAVNAGGTLANLGVVRMGNTGPAILRADGFTNTNTGAVLGRGSIQAPVTNSGNIALSGDSSFTEDVTNQSGGKIIISGGSAVTFFEDVDNQAGAEIRVSQDSTATYFGQRLAGGGLFTGTGTSYIEGDMRPGASPGIMAFEGNVVFGPSASLEIELNGPTPGSGHDQLDVVGTVSLGGAGLDLSLGYTPGRGDHFVIINNHHADPIVGEFAGMGDDSSVRIGGYPFRIDYQGGDGNDVGLVPAWAEVSARHVFYNGSSFDDPAAGRTDNDAMAPGKVPLMPGQTAGFDNYTSYSRGINGVMVDVAGLAGTPTADDFEFKVGNNNNPDSWSDAPDLADVTVRPGEGVDDRAADAGGPRVVWRWPAFRHGCSAADLGGNLWPESTAGVRHPRGPQSPGVDVLCDTLSFLIPP